MTRDLEADEIGLFDLCHLDKLRRVNQHEEEISSSLPTDLDSLPRLKGFRLRGIEMTRLETFIDAAFAFAVTMLVIAGGQVPDDIQALLVAFKNVPAFVASIAVLSVFWRGHWLWSRRFGLEDGVSILISWAMLVTILIYVYPLKLLFGGMLLHHGSRGRAGDHCAYGRTSASALRHLWARFQRNRRGDSPAESAGMEAARTIASERSREIIDARGTFRMEHSGGGGACVAASGANFTDAISPMERLGVHVDGVPGAAAEALAGAAAGTTEHGGLRNLSLLRQSCYGDQALLGRATAGRLSNCRKEMHVHR